MNPLSISAASAANFMAMLIIALFLLRLVGIKLANTPAGKGLLALI